ncbi:MAG: DegV family protein [Eubacteriales bacterium]
MIKIITDSTSYLPQDIKSKYDIAVLPFRVFLDGQPYKETELTNKEFFEKAKSMPTIPQPEGPSYEVMLDAFEKELKAGNSIVGIFMSSRAGETIVNAKKAKDKLLQKYTSAHISIVDSLNACIALGLIVMAAAEANKHGAWHESVEEAAKEAVLRTKFFFSPKNLDYVLKRQEINKAKAVIGNAIQLIPLLSTEHGVLSPKEMVRTQSKAIEKMVEFVQQDMKDLGIAKAVVTHIDAYDEAVELARKVKKTSDVYVEISEMGPAVGQAVGPGTVGLAYSTIDAPF